MCPLRTKLVARLIPCGKTGMEQSTGGSGDSGLFTRSPMDSCLRGMNEEDRDGKSYQLETKSALKKFLKLRSLPNIGMLAHP